MLNPVIRKESERQERRGKRGDDGGGRGPGSGTDLKYGPISLGAKNKLPQDSHEEMIWFE